MKKVLSFIRSMRFGMILLILIGILCAIATVTGKEGIYSSWYFILLFTVLAVNLTLCSVLRMFHFSRQKQALLKKAEKSPVTFSVPDAERWLKKHHFRQSEGGYLKHKAGFLGSFLTHASMLLLMAAAACIFTFAQREDLNLCVGDTAELPDGTKLTVEAFRMEDETGELEYISTLTALLPDGNEEAGEALVNHPLRMGRYTIYQQNYAFAAVIGVRTGEQEPEELVKLEEPAFLSLDGENGIYYSQMYGNVVEENGEVRVSHGNEITNPAYEVAVSEYGGNQTGLVYPGTTIAAGGVLYTFHDPEAYPGLRIKTQPDWALWLLYFSFALMTVGLYLCFFQIPEAAHVKPDGISIVGQKDLFLQIEQYRSEAADQFPPIM